MATLTMNPENVEPLADAGSALRIKRGSYVVLKVQPGGIYVSNVRERIMTLLGSCIAACIRDPLVGVGGMNHFLLPQSRETSGLSWGTAGGDDNRFGNVAMENLIGLLLRNGGAEERLEMKLFGGAKLLNLSNDVGAQNIEYANDFARRRGIDILASDVGGTAARLVVYCPLSGRAHVRRVGSTDANRLISNEQTLSKAYPDMQGSDQISGKIK